MPALLNVRSALRGRRTSGSLTGARIQARWLVHRNRMGSPCSDLAIACLIREFSEVAVLVAADPRLASLPSDDKVIPFAPIASGRSLWASSVGGDPHRAWRRGQYAGSSPFLSLGLEDHCMKPPDTGMPI